MFRFGFVVILGPTNSGKSTLLNSLVGRKISIVSQKVQTTYHCLRGILNRADSQIAFVDTPGFQAHRQKISNLLNTVAQNAANGVDLSLWVFDAADPRIETKFKKLLPRMKNFPPPYGQIAVLNKIDKIPKLSLLPLIQSFSSSFPFTAVIPVSALRSDGIQNLINVIEQVLPEGTALFPRDKITDRDDSFLVSEFIREKIYGYTHQEIPYSVRVETENMSEGASRVPTVRAVIHVDSESKKGILIGKKGERLKVIGTRAREDIEKWLGRSICLKLFVDVENDWTFDKHKIRRYLELS